MTTSSPGPRRPDFSLRRVALACGLGMAFALLGSGCGESNGDQTAARLQDIPYTFDNLADEVAGRLQEARRRGTEKAPAKLPSSGSGVLGGDAERGAGPGGNPFSIEAIALDVAEKLQRLQYAHADEKVLSNFGEALRGRKVPADLVEPFLAKLKTVELPPADKS